VKAALERERTRRNQRKIDGLFPDTGPLRRELYVKHLELFRAGAVYRERLVVAGNRCGKTTAGAYEMAMHLTGHHPHWWEGRRFDGAIGSWAVRETSRRCVISCKTTCSGPVTLAAPA
jgi:Terminase large subunit, T4likevirus-type, N-terminal